MRLTLWMTGVSALMVCAGCGDLPTDELPTGDSPEGRWAARTVITDFDFTAGRGVALDEVFELSADGTMRGDFSGMDDVSGCVVSYQLFGDWQATDDSIDVSWSSIDLTVTGCTDPELDVEGDVTESEGGIWDDELDGTWVISESTLAIVTDEGSLTYERVTSPLVARWEGTSVVSDFTFAFDREVDLVEDFWMNHDGSMLGYFTAYDPVSGCVADYRLSGSWWATDATLDASWSSITLEVFGCDDPSFDQERTEVDEDEAALWNEELDGEWSVTDDSLTLVSTDGVLVYQRP